MVRNFFYLHFSKNSKNWLEIQKSKRNISLTNGAFQKKISLSILSHRAFLKIICVLTYLGILILRSIL